jgi:hypothetical protein
MSALAELHGLQRRFQHAVLAKDHVPGLFVGEAVDKVGGFDLYLAAYRARLVAALRDNFMVLNRAMGDEAFGELAHAYVAAHPSHFRSIRWFGHGLPVFLDANPALLAHPALADLARMDWALRGAFDAPNAVSMVLDELAALATEAWPAHRFIPLPSLSVVDLQWTVEPIWRALNADPEAQTDAPERRSHALLVWRPGLECQWRSIDVVEASALRALQRGATFAECCELIAAGAMASEVASEVAAASIAVGLLQRWIADGVLSTSKESE